MFMAGSTPGGETAGSLILGRVQFAPGPVSPDQVDAMDNNELGDSENRLY